MGRRSGGKDHARLTPHTRPWGPETPRSHAPVADHRDIVLAESGRIFRVRLTPDGCLLQIVRMANPSAQAARDLAQIIWKAGDVIAADLVPVIEEARRQWTQEQMR
jgi:hypothetical protein